MTDKGNVLAPSDPTSKMTTVGESMRYDSAISIDAIYRAMLAAAPDALGAHTDDIAVDKFAAAMKKKLAAARAKGRGGWDDREDLEQHLSNLLRAHVDKGDPIDVANFCCFLWNRCEAICAAPAAQVAVGFPWENFPSFLIDKCEGDTITEERLQRAAADMLTDPKYMKAATPAVVVDEAMKRRAAEAIANARAGRRGAPAITNVLDILPPNLLAEVMEDAEDALAAALKVSP